jgi:hypothetical protein
VSTDALPVPPDLRPLLDRPGLDLDQLVWAAVRDRVARLQRLDALARRGRLTRADAAKLAARLREEADAPRG